MKCTHQPVMVIDRSHDPPEYRVICVLCGETTKSAFYIEENARRAWELEHAETL